MNNFQPYIDSFKPFKEELDEASFKGIKFEVTSHKSEFGHRNASFAFPFNDRFEIQEFGKKQSTYKITGFLLGKDYAKKRDDLIKCVNDGGSGELIHPYLGRLVVFCQQISVSESFEKYGYCLIEFDFVESSKIIPIVPKINKPKIVIDVSNDVKFNLLNAFISAINFIKDLVKEVSNRIYQAQMAIKSVINSVRDVERFLGSVAQIATDFAYLIKNVINMFDTIMAFPDVVGNLIDGVLETFNKVLSNDSSKRALPTAINVLITPTMFTATNADIKKNKTKTEQFDESKKVLSSYKEIYNIELINKNNDPNIKEIQKFVQTHVLASACAYAASNAKFPNINEAIKTRDELIFKIDKLMDDETINDKVFNSLYNLRISTYDALSSIANEIPVIKSYKNDGFNDLISFCFENFGTIENLDDIISLNNIDNPLFIEDYLDIKVILNDNIAS